jgi:hypothetical protein
MDRKFLRLLHEAIKRFELNLDGLSIFTEAASGHFMATPLIALEAGAFQVFAIAKDSRYGTRQMIGEGVVSQASHLSNPSRLNIVYDYEQIGKADIITNLGFVRPIDAKLVAQLKSQAVIPLMWETWEYRPADLDLAACRQKGIMVLGTNEQHSKLNFHRYLGHLAARLCYEAGLELCDSRILLLADCRFGPPIQHHLQLVGAHTFWHSPSRGDSLEDPKFKSFLQEANAILFAEHSYTNMLAGPDSWLGPLLCQRFNGGIKCVHISGVIDTAWLKELGFPVFPELSNPITPHTMSHTTGYLGGRPIVELHTAGLKVGETMARAYTQTKDFQTSRKTALKNDLCQDFTPEQYLRYSLE